MCGVPHAPLHGFRQERQRELQLGCGRAGYDARLRGDDDALRPVHLLRHSRSLCNRILFPDLCQDEHGRGRHHQVDTDTRGCVPVPYRCVRRLPGLLRLPHITPTV